ncbi:MerR family transcriptional regulator [Streptomyces regalis]|uniref:MerR family transcriptional regulator n=1 Tax=Streptomyces regalis TaxID=68262 RepID=UPI001FCA2C73|nr:MerR family transcriptional regulator [Streptomyces regalis]
MDRRDAAVNAGLRSGQVAEAAGVNVQTLRYYERRGLLAEPERSNGGHRLYGEDAVTALRVIKAAQRLGFTRTGRPRHRPVPRRADHKDPPRSRWPLPASGLPSHRRTGR